MTVSVLLTETTSAEDTLRGASCTPEETVYVEPWTKTQFIINNITTGQVDGINPVLIGHITSSDGKRASGLVAIKIENETGRILSVKIAGKTGFTDPAHDMTKPDWAHALPARIVFTDDSKIDPGFEDNFGEFIARECLDGKP